MKTTNILQVIYFIHIIVHLAKSGSKTLKPLRVIGNHVNVHLAKSGSKTLKPLWVIGNHVNVPLAQSGSKTLKPLWVIGNHVNANPTTIQSLPQQPPMKKSSV